MKHLYLLNQSQCPSGVLPGYTQAAEAPQLGSGQALMVRQKGPKPLTPRQVSLDGTDAGYGDRTNSPGFSLDSVCKIGSYIHGEDSYDS